jgi:hypothetical protein
MHKYQWYNNGGTVKVEPHIKQSMEHNCIEWQCEEKMLMPQDETRN